VNQTAVVDHRSDAVVDLEAIRDGAAADREAMLRLAAEFDNYRKRVERDRLNQASLAAARICSGEGSSTTMPSVSSAPSFKPPSGMGSTWNSSPPAM